MEVQEVRTVRVLFTIFLGVRTRQALAAGFKRMQKGANLN